MQFKKLSDHVSILSFEKDQEHGEVYILELFPGITLGLNYINIHRIIGDAGEATERNTLRINYCFEGRCEVKLADGRYVYVDNNALCIESHAPQYNYYYPLGFYKGIQIFIDVDIIKSQHIETYDLLGIQPRIIVDTFSNTNKTYIQTASDKFSAKSTELMSTWENKELTLEKKLQQIRLDLCQLLLYIINEQATNKSKPYNASCLSYSQYMIAIDCEQQIMQDLSKRLTVENMAKEYKISPSSLKKFFSGVYGYSISEYTQTMRMKRATELLQTTDESIMGIAASVGYENQSKFSAVFKKHTGYAPLEYKRIYQLKRKEVHT